MLLFGATLLLSLLLAVAAQTICPSSWTLWETDCYRLYENKVYYNKAMTNCASAVSLQSTLASIHSAEEQAFLNTFTSEHQYVWIGLTDLDTEGQFRWTDGTPLDYTNWAPQQPDNLNNSDCVFLLPDGTWDDGKCEHHPFDTTPAKVYVCKTKAT